MDMGSNSPNSPESLNGLKFGHKIYFEDVDSGVAVTPPKKGRGVVVQGGQPPRCQVEGCGVDLSDAKVYYSRHKVCGMHSKSPMVIVAGLQQRFCQQCSRFHLLPEFDQGKRSCRRRLAGHNERRRKPQSVPLYTMHHRPPASSMFEKAVRGGGYLMNFTTYPGMIPTDSWLATRGYGPGFGTQTYSPAPAYDNNCALSLLSKQPSHTRNLQTTTNLGSNYLLNIGSVNMVQSATRTTWGLKGNGTTSTQFSGPSWDFKDGEGSRAVPDLGLGQVSHLDACQYSGEVDMAGQSGRQCMELEQSRTLGSPSQHGDWSL